MKPVQIGRSLVGPGNPVFAIAEIGINHNGDIEIAKKLIRVANAAGFDAVKFQKRTVDTVYTAAELAAPRENPFGPTNGDLKRGLEFGLEQYKEIDAYCKKEGILWFASCWDEASVDFMEQFDPPCYKIASASLTDDELLLYHRKKCRPLFLSTGMSTMSEIDHAVELLGRDKLILMHTVSTYPAKSFELNLNVIPNFIRHYDIPIGYSGHEVGLSTTVAAVALGACCIERHVTMERAMWGSDQAASVEPQGVMSLMKNIRAVESALGDGLKKVMPTEVPIMKKLRRKGLKLTPENTAR